MTEKDNTRVFDDLIRIIDRKGVNFDLKEKVINSKAKGKKRGLHIYGKKKVSIAGRKPQQTYLAGIIEQKNFVGLYFMPIYSHPNEFNKLSEDLKKTLKGKSCFNIKTLNPDMLKELDSILAKGILLYKKEGWV